jgi:glycerol-3-phosphate dehydrogenase (NAD(P)+)
MSNLPNSSIAVLGAGAWGTALAIQLGRYYPYIRLWGRCAEQITHMETTRINQRYLHNYKLPDTIHCTTNLREVIHDTHAILIALPSHALPDILEKLKPLLTRSHHLLFATKGLYPTSGELLPIWLEKNYKKQSFAFLSGPSFAQEVAEGLPTALTLACTDLTCATDWKQRLHYPKFQITLTTDLIGVSLYGVMKNIIAIIIGVLDGLRLGANARARLITQSLSEMNRLGKQLGAQDSTCLGLAGVGDLILTCLNDLSRNRQFGLAIGQGAMLPETQQHLRLRSEGFLNTTAICQLAKKQGIPIPICDTVYAMLFENMPPQTAIAQLFKSEFQE